MLTEGKTKTNIKEPSLECSDCGYYAYQNKFQFGFLWWANEHCPKCWSKNLDYAKKKGNPPKPTKTNKIL